MSTRRGPINNNTTITNDAATSRRLRRVNRGRAPFGRIPTSLRSSSSVTESVEPLNIRYRKPRPHCSRRRAGPVLHRW
ncbi:Uncharacterised protein [Mycobacteroides abscessus subsp. abscessus]|nr:Uncharacterised protein [Mycobacteroides abscessus subsp. abscessus]